MSKREPKIIELPYMGPHTDKDRQEEQKRYESTMPVTSGTKRKTPVPAHVRDRDYAKGGRVRTASQRADGIAIRGKTRA